MKQKKICLLGAYAVGKTSLADRFMGRPFTGRYLTTIGVRIDRRVLGAAGREVGLMIWDMAGEDRFQRVEEAYLRGASGYFLVVDGTRPGTLDEARMLRERAESVVGAVPFRLLLNKADLVTEWAFDDRVVAGLAEQGWRVERVSAKTGEGVESALDGLVEQMMGVGG